MTLNSYLNFSGKTQEAMEFYKSVLGGELTIQTFGQAKMAKDPKDENRVMHAVLKTDGFVLMASDTMPGKEAEVGNNVHLSLNGTAEEKERMTAAFEKLSEGGKVVMPLGEQFWGDIFGMLVDKFGIHWMMNIGKGMSAV
jgi:PhnB protein